MAAGEREGQAIAERITAAMEAQGIKRQQLADRAGVPRETLARKLERVPEDFKVSEIARLAVALNEPFEFLVWGVELEVSA